MKSQGLVKHCLQVWPQDPRRHRRRVGQPRDGVGPGAEAADDREPGLVKVRKTDILWVHTFVVAFMQQHTGPTASLQVSLN